MNVKPSETAALVKAIAEATAAYADKVEIVLIDEELGM